MLSIAQVLLKKIENSKSKVLLPFPRKKGRHLTEKNAIMIICIAILELHVHSSGNTGVHSNATHMEKVSRYHSSTYDIVCISMAETDFNTRLVIAVIQYNVA